MKFGAVSAQQLVTVDALHGRRLLPRRVLGTSTSVVVPDDIDRPTYIASSSAARLGGNCGASTPDDVGEVGDEEVVRQSPDATGWKRCASAAAWTQQVAVVRQQEPVRPVLLVHLVVRLETVGAERVLTDEHLRVAVGARTQPTFEELVVQLLDEVSLDIVADFSVI